MGIDIIRINVHVCKQVSYADIVLPLTKESVSFIKDTLFNEGTSLLFSGLNLSIL